MAVHTEIKKLIDEQFEAYQLTEEEKNQLSVEVAVEIINIILNKIRKKET